MRSPLLPERTTRTTPIRGTTTVVLPSAVLNSVTSTPGASASAITSRPLTRTGTTTLPGVTPVSSISAPRAAPSAVNMPVTSGAPANSVVEVDLAGDLVEVGDGVRRDRAAGERATVDPHVRDRRAGRHVAGHDVDRREPALPHHPALGPGVRTADVQRDQPRADEREHDRHAEQGGARPHGSSP